MRTTRVSKDKGELEYAVIKDKLLYLLEATANKLEREWHPRYRHVDDKTGSQRAHVAAI